MKLWEKLFNLILKWITKEKEEPEEPEKPQITEFQETYHGRLIEWVVTGENNGKKVYVYEDGYHEMTAKATFEAIDGLTDWYADRVNNAESMRDAKIIKIECKVHTYLKNKIGKFTDTGEECKVPDKVTWTFSLSNGGKMEFNSIASADCIQPGYVYMWDEKGRPQHSPSANGHGVGQNSFYKGKRIYIR